jgi:hypothetical protein
MVFTSTRKIKVYKSSVGNKVLFNQISRCKNTVVLLPEQSSQEDIMNSLLKTKNCCSAGHHFMGCLGYKFAEHNSSDKNVDMKSLCNYIQECRNLTRFKNAPELRQFIKEVYDQAEVSQSNRKTLMDYRLPVLASTSHITKSNNKVCRKGIHLNIKNYFSNYSTNERINKFKRNCCCLWILYQIPSNLFEIKKDRENRIIFEES